MAIVSYYDEHELEKVKTVSNEELNELLLEVREKDDRYYLEEKTFMIKKWFRKPMKKTFYTLLFNTGGCECQIINFCQDRDWSINTSVPKSYITTYFYGFLNGYKRGGEKQAS
jgi:hypothetical protein